jgi:hypothetical protein
MYELEPPTRVPFTFLTVESQISFITSPLLLLRPSLLDDDVKDFSSSSMLTLYLGVTGGTGLGGRGWPLSSTDTFVSLATPWKRSEPKDGVLQWHGDSLRGVVGFNEFVSQARVLFECESFC